MYVCICVNGCVHRCTQLQSPEEHVPRDKLLVEFGTHPPYFSKADIQQVPATLLSPTPTFWHWVLDARGHTQVSFYLDPGHPNSVQQVVLPTEPSAKLFSCKWVGFLYRHIWL